MIINNYWETIPGWFDFANLYDHMVRLHKDGAHFVEVGVWFGRSICYLATQVKAANKKIKIGAVDIWKKEGNSSDGIYDEVLDQYGGNILGQFISNITNAEVSHLIDVYAMTSIEAASIHPDGSLDFVFIDANHFYEKVREDILAWLPKIKVGGFIAGHDYETGPQVKRAVNEIFGGTYPIQQWGNSWLVHKKG